MEFFEIRDTEITQIMNEFGISFEDALNYIIDMIEIQNNVGYGN